jgi:predicted nucleic-acid-binding Zn-ribbon protein
VCPKQRRGNVKSGKCPKCESASVHSKPGGLGFANVSRISVYAGSIGKPSTTAAYLCTTCGYFEVYLTDKDFLAEAAKAWSRVTGS